MRPDKDRASSTGNVFGVVAAIVFVLFLFGALFMRGPTAPPAATAPAAVTPAPPVSAPPAAQ